MRLNIGLSAFTLWVSASDTERWAIGHFGQGRWPCSELAGSRFCVTFDTNGLCDFTLSGLRDKDVDQNELNACISDFLKDKLPTDHPCYFVAVGQFLSTEDKH